MYYVLLSVFFIVNQLSNKVGNTSKYFIISSFILLTNILVLSYINSQKGMDKMEATIPTFNQSSFCCPHCKVFAAQEWEQALYYSPEYRNSLAVKNLMVCKCVHCNDYSFWYHEEMVYPSTSLAPSPHPDMPSEIIDDYNEAANILDKSPRGTAALLRLVLQKLMKSLGESGRNIDADIKSLVQKGLPVEIQQALDIVRVIGNESVHPGSIDMKDNREIAVKLFNLINFIVQNRITQPKEISSLFESLPEGKRKAIAKRDGISK
ncbi:DUF4145 domain-containing protein [Bacillus thuringiensis]|nr:DUF4145 domain-containing protein [Bacillus thuringiensis]